MVRKFVTIFHLVSWFCLLNGHPSLDKINQRDDNLHILNISEDATEELFNPNLKIVGGSVVSNREDFAYQASLRRTDRNSHMCGASIINDRNILTAAHCVCNDDGTVVSPSTLTIVVGDLDIRTSTEHTIVRVVKKIFAHSKYNPSTFENDIAVLRVESLGNFTDYVNKVDLAKSTPGAGTNCVVSGWGTTSSGGSASYVLMQVAVPIVTKQQCSIGYPGGILNGMLCAGYMQGGKDACQGDSGGPLVCDGKLAGVVSWGYQCALPNYPGIYTDVAFYYDWIQAKSHAAISNIKVSLILFNIFVIAVISKVNTLVL